MAEPGSIPPGGLAAGQQAGSQGQKEGATCGIWVGGAVGFLFKGVGTCGVWQREEK